MRPRMIITAGPPGSGKSTAFPVQEEGVDFFNADDRAAQLNGGSYQNIPELIRAQVNKEFEAFVLTHIERRESFALETTLRSDITLRQARQARAWGFETTMTYIALDDVTLNVERVSARADAGGHSAPESKLREIHTQSLANLPIALAEIDYAQVYDNSREPELVMETQNGLVTYLAERTPEWLEKALQETDYEITDDLRSKTSGQLDRDHIDDFER